MQQLSALSVAAVLATASLHFPQQLSRAQAPAELRIDWLGQSAVIPARSPGETSLELANLVARERRHVVVQFSRALSESEKARAGEAGLELLAYLGNHAWFAAAGAATLDAPSVAGLPLAAAMAPRRAWKLHPMLERGEVPAWTVVDEKDGTPTIGTYVLFHADVARPERDAAILRHGGRIRDAVESVHALVVEIPFDALAALAEEDAVQYVEPALPRMVDVNSSNRVITGVNVVQQVYGLDGSGVSVMVYDGGTARASHLDFGGRLSIRDGDGLSFHATHVSGTIGGSGAASGGTHRGMAPGVTLQSYGFEYDGTGTFLYTNPGDFEADYADAINNHDAAVSNNSIGTNTESNGFDCSFQGNYGLMSSLIDAAVRGSLSGAPYRIVWSAGNERQGSRCDIEGYGDYYSTAPPAGAKNHLAIGALNSNDDSMTTFSSWGPTDDGRLKPDFAGPGCESGGDGGVTSCDSSSDSAYTTLCGTSMSGPTVTGIVALMLQDYRAQFGGPDPRNSTVKALLAQSAVDILDVGPDYRSGYGSVRATAAIDLMRTGSFAERQVVQGETLFFTVYVTPADSELEVTVAWDDVPGTPNVTNALVNDVDLHVFSPSGVEHFPWTLDPLNPSAAAVRTGRDHRNNIEQVRVGAPEAGSWRVEVRGFNVPSGPQSFSIVAAPELIECGSQGIVLLDGASFRCSDSALVRVIDCDLNTDDTTVESVNVSVTSSSEPLGEVLTLTETGPATAAFAFSLPLATTDAPGVLLVAEGDSIVASYLDADDGNGNTGVTVTAMAGIDCTGPVISNLAVSNVTATGATIQFDVDEPTTGRVDYGTLCANPSATAQSGQGTHHTLVLSGLADGTTHTFALTATDPAGNVTVDDNGGLCHEFDTEEVPDAFTEEFGPLDMAGRRITFTPSASFEAYDACTRPGNGSFSTDPAGGFVLPLSDDDWELVLVGNGNTVKLYGAAYDRFYVGSNGYITFGTGDSDYTESLADHFDTPRISANFDDYNPAATGSGTVSYRRLPDRMAVTWNGVYEYATSNPSWFQIELFYDGRIRLTYLTMSSTDGVAGLSEGLGLPTPFLESDLSAYDCEPSSKIAPSSGAPASGGTRSL
ncbi:MAG TPA: S8 family serine peptidase [Planctomycetota bacterium]